MELIIKPTGRCDFACTFCSASELDIPHPTNGVQPQIKDLIKKMKPNGIIVTGGEPLTIDPDYYFELQELGQCTVGLTSNMKNFYKDPYKWKEMLAHPMINVGTSFQYGPGRMWDKDTVYTEDMFLKVNDLYQEITGSEYGLHFIAVITEENEDMFMSHVHLAKRINSRVKINGATALGRQGTTYPRWKIIRGYLDIIKMGLEMHETTTAERALGKCAMNTRLGCTTTIRCCYVDSNGELRYSVCDDTISMGIEVPMDTFPVIYKPDYPSVTELYKPECMSCELHRMCNGCPTYRKHNKQCKEHCERMTEMKDEIIATGWAL